MAASPTPAATTETVWAGFHQPLRRFVRRRVRGPAVAEDLLQEIFIKIHLRLNTLAQAERLAAWVYQIARRTVLDYERRPRPATAALADELAYLLPADLLFTDPAADPGADAGPDLAGCLAPFLNRLPADYRQALQLTELGSLSQKEYAAQLGLSYSGAKSRVQRARRQLHELFTACCRIEADAYGNVLTAQPRAAGGCEVGVPFCGAA